MKYKDVTFCMITNYITKSEKYDLVRSCNLDKNGQNEGKLTCKPL